MSGNEGLIKIIVINDIPYILEADDWMRLRRQYGIFGFFDGAQTENTMGLSIMPIKLAMYEAKYLVEHGLAEAFEILELFELKAPASEEAFAKRREQSYQEQVKQYKEHRRLQIESMVDKIIEGKLRKGRCVLPDREAVIEDELAKITTLPFEQVQIDLKDPWLTESSLKPYILPEFETPFENLRYRVYNDFRANMKYHLTTGYKFGGDFLAYKGDPMHYHADYIIMCEHPERPFTDVYLRSQSRLATTVKKKLIVASIDKSTDTIQYKLVSRPGTVEEEANAAR